ncbi:MAG: hypothetical protein BKPUNTRY_002973 [Candidatus Fervidibacter sp.]
MLSATVGLLLPGTFLRHPDAISGEPGSSVAGRELLRALLTYSEVPLTLFVSEYHADAMRRECLILADITGFDTFPSHRIIPIHQMAYALANMPLLALHDLNGPFLDLVAYARSRFADGAMFPVTCMEYGFSYQNFLRELVVRLLLTPTYPCDALVCTTQVAKQATQNILQRLRERLQEDFGCSLPSPFQLAVIPHGIDTDLFKPRDKADMRTLLELPKDKLIVLYMGRIDPASKSDVIPLLIAFQRVAQKHADQVLLLLVGPITDIYRGKVDEVIRELGLQGKVLLRTGIPKVNVPLYYSAADIFISLSDTLQENFGLTPLEAMASGLPVVVSDWAGYRELVVHGETGFKVPTMWGESDETLCDLAPFYDWSSDHFYVGQTVAAKPEAVAHFLDLLVSNEPLRQEIGKRARQHVLSHYHWRNIVRQFWELWSTLREVATSIERSFKTDGLIRPRYYCDFQHFATFAIHGDDRVYLTQRGFRVCCRKEGLFLLDDARSLLRSDAAMKFLRFIRYCTALRLPLTIAQVEKVVGHKWKMSPEEVRRYILWAFKYGLIHIHHAGEEIKGSSLPQR